MQVIEFQQLSNTPPLWRVSVAHSAAKTTYCNNTNYLENLNGSSKISNPAELERVLQYMSHRSFAQRNRAMLMMTVAAGLRVGEVAGLTLGDVLDDDGQVRGEIYLAAHRTKHNHARTIYLNSRLQAELAAYIQQRTVRPANFPLFPTNRGDRCAFSANTLTQHFFWIYKRAGIAGGSSHSGRKTFLTSLAGQGVSVFVLAALAGHKSIATTQRYITVNDDTKRRAVELV